MGIGQIIRSRLFRLLLDALLIVGITFILGELVLRLGNRIRPSFVFYNDTYNRFRGRPFALNYDFPLNSKGFKDVEFSSEKGQTYRIVALGDSFAFGVVPYKYNYLTILEESLNEPGRGVEVCNMGIVGTGPREYLSLLVAEGIQLNPDLVLLSFFIGNDFYDTVSSQEKRPLYEHSYVATLLHYFFAVRPSYAGRVMRAGQTYDDDASVFSSETFLNLERRRARICSPDFAEFDNYLALSIKYLKDIDRICRREDIEFVVVLIPDQFQIDTTLQSLITHSVPSLDPKAWDFSRPNRMLSEILWKENIQYLDLYDSFSKTPDSVKLYKTNDTHWNIAGNNLAAVQIGQYLEDTVFH